MKKFLFAFLFLFAGMSASTVFAQAKQGAVITMNIRNDARISNVEITIKEPNKDSYKRLITSKSFQTFKFEVGTKVYYTSDDKLIFTVTEAMRGTTRVILK